MRRKAWLVTFGLFAVAGLLCAIGMGWAIASGVAIPDQDPTPTMVAHARFHDAIVDRILMAATVALAAGVLAFFYAGAALLVGVIRARRPRGHPKPLA